mmetsp:Transcript_26463/g.45956  ORF Transcript_26463/g.45956 Transcript_26463/m.45956 type:complete len:450 (+) Transcript_26463:93-1442(+)
MASQLLEEDSLQRLNPSASNGKGASSYGSVNDPVTAKELDEPGPNVPRLLWTMSLNAAMLGIGMALALLGPTLVGIAANLQMPFAAAGALFSFRSVGYLVGSLLCGVLMDNCNNVAAVFLAPLAAACASACLIPHTQSFFLACILLSTQGLSMGMLDTGGNVLLLVLWHGSDYLNGLMHALHFFFGLGAFVAPLLVGWWVQEGYDPVQTWNLTFIGLLLPVNGFFLLCFAPQPKTKPEAPGETVLNRVVLLSGTFLFFYVGMEVTFGGYIDVFAVRWLGAPESDAAFLNSFYWGFLCLGRLVAAVVTPYVNHIRYLAVHVAAAAASIGLLLFATHSAGTPIVGSIGWWSGVVFPTAVFGFALAPLFPGAVLVAEELLGGSISGKAASILVMVAALGEMLVPLVTGALFACRATSFCWMQLFVCCASSIVFISNGSELLFQHKVVEHGMP